MCDISVFNVIYAQGGMQPCTVLCAILVFSNIDVTKNGIPRKLLGPHQRVKHQSNCIEIGFEMSYCGVCTYHRLVCGGGGYPYVTPHSNM